MDKENLSNENKLLSDDISNIEGRLKHLRDSGYWSDACVVDGQAVYGAEGRVLLCVDENVEEFDVPERVENIYHRCFSGCEKLQRVNLPSSVKRIGKRAFYGYCRSRFSLYDWGRNVYELCIVEACGVILSYNGDSSKDVL